MSNLHDIYAIVLMLSFAAAAGIVGSFALMKRMLLAGDVISHLALPGIGLALLLHWNPLMGGAVSLFAGTLLVAQLQRRTGLANDAMIAVVFAVSLATGAALTPQQDMVDALFGHFGQLSLAMFLLGIGSVLAVLLYLWRSKDPLVLSLFSPELATASGVNLGRQNLAFLLIFSLTVLIGLRFMGALLAGALIMLPAAIGRHLARDLRGFLVASAGAGMLSVAIGVGIAAFVRNRIPLGATAAIAAGLLFALTLFLPLRRIKS
jgi:ABC-type Mn2+/Zn2+ transport system permease subunit